LSERKPEGDDVAGNPRDDQALANRLLSAKDPAFSGTGLA
jgi:hypothetical protein